MTVVGTGSFSSTRIATTLANSFAYNYQIPLLAIDKDQALSVQKLIPTLLEQTEGQYVSATYSGEPNINKPKI